MSADRLIIASSSAESFIDGLKYEDAAHVLFTIPLLLSLKGDVTPHQSADIQYLIGVVLFPNNNELPHPSHDQIGRALRFMGQVNEKDLNRTSLETLLLHLMNKLSTKYPENVDQHRFVSAVNSIMGIFAQPK